MITITISNCWCRSFEVLFVGGGIVDFLMIVVPFVITVLFIIGDTFAIFILFGSYFSIKLYLLYIILQIFVLDFVSFIIFFFLSLYCFCFSSFCNFHLHYFISSLSLICLNFKECLQNLVIFFL